MVCIQTFALGSDALHATSAINVDIKDLWNGSFDHKLVRVSGLVVDARKDEIAGNCEIITILNKGHTITLVRAITDEKRLRGLLGAKVSAVGICHPDIGGYRHYHYRGIRIEEDDILVLRSADDEFLLAKDICTLRKADYVAINTCQERMSVTGCVTAVWSQNKVLVKTPDEAISQISLVEGVRPPQVGQSIKAIGFPETDMISLNLGAALWKPASERILVTESQPIDINGRLSASVGTNNLLSVMSLHGKPVRIRGKVLATPAEEFDEPHFLLDCNGLVVPVDVSGVPDIQVDIPIGSTVGISGILLAQAKDWRPSNPFPRLIGFCIIPRRSSDITIISQPPWITPARLTVVILLLLVVLLAFLLWIRILKKLIERRSRQLYREELSHAASELRIRERTRLAVELHDALSQNISSAALQIDAAERLSEVDRTKERHHLQIAAKTLQSCRTELKNCLWDLRNRTFDEPDIAKTILRVLSAHVGDTNLSVRFNVSRQKLSDNAVHTILRIIRELTINAIRHGQAKSIRIAGALADGKLAFSVTDDGGGFNPDDTPGIAEGHFGLQGIRERIRLFGGEMTLESEIGGGTKVKISLDAIRLST